MISCQIKKKRQDILNKQSKKGEYVFDIPNRGQAGLFRRTVYQIKKRTGIDFHFHLLRHYFATSLIEKGIDIVTIGSLLGHSKTTVSLMYSHMDQAKKRKAVEIIKKKLDLKVNRELFYGSILCIGLKFITKHEM
ncbi:MAG: tyrosine-type recombinase/integrase [Candidatus Aminicenantaceae bacterium]